LLQLTFIELGTIITNGRTLREYEALHPNDTWSYVSEDTILLEATNTTLVGGILSVRAVLIKCILPYSLC
jgi:hypothetical protein